MSRLQLPRIVLAEDDDASRVLLARQLTKAGYEVIACEDGQAALQAIRNEISCIVLADWMMPRMDGLELCRTVRGLTEMQALSFVYFILLTAHNEKEHIITGLEAGADDYLTKPYHPRELLARLRVGERICALQRELFQRQVELHKVNGQLAGLNRKLETLANTDTLTGAANRRHLFDHLSGAWALTQRKGQPLACIMFDIDHFKRVNDTYGHASGDEILKEVCASARNCLRRYDTLGRVGGEEFCIVCPDTAIDGAAALAERLRCAIASLQCALNGKTISVTISLGVATHRPDHTGPDALLSTADAMLYRAKRNGRNQVWLCDSAGQTRRLETLVGTS